MNWTHSLLSLWIHSLQVLSSEELSTVPSFSCPEKIQGCSLSGKILLSILFFEFLDVVIFFPNLFFSPLCRLISIRAKVTLFFR